MNVARSGHTASLLKDGRVLIAGDDTAFLEIYDPAAQVFTPGAYLSAARSGHAAAVL